MLFKLLLQLLIGVACGVKTVGGSCCSLALGVSSHGVAGHVLAVEVGAVLHVLYGGGAQHLVHVLVAVELVRQGVEEAVALGKVSLEHENMG